jgi:hypothetical protein
MGVPRVETMGVPRAETMGVPRAEIMGVPRAEIMGVPRAEPRGTYIHRLFVSASLDEQCMSEPSSHRAQSSSHRARPRGGGLYTGVLVSASLDEQFQHEVCTFLIHE